MPLTPDMIPDSDASETPSGKGLDAGAGSPGLEPWIGNCPKCRTPYRTNPPEDTMRPLVLHCGRPECVGMVEMTPIEGFPEVSESHACANTHASALNETPETNEAWNAYDRRAAGLHWVSDQMRQMERDRDTWKVRAEAAERVCDELHAELRSARRLIGMVPTNMGVPADAWQWLKDHPENS